MLAVSEHWLREGCGVVPGHPGRRIQRHLGRVAQQGNEVVERLDLVEFGGMDQGHEQITDARAVQRPIEERVLPMQNGLFEYTFGDVVVEWGARHAQKQAQFLPVVLHV